VIDQDHDQHGAPPKVDVADAVWVHHQASGRKTTPLLGVFPTREGKFRGGDGAERFVRRRPAQGCNERAAEPPITFAKFKRCSPRIDHNVAAAM
jgi:hypothetical protein